MPWIRGRAMSRQADAEPIIGPTRPARSRTTSILSPATAPAVPASNAVNKKSVKRVVIANLREAKVLACRSAIVTFLSKRIHRGYRDALPGAMAPILFKSDNVESSDEPVGLGTTPVLSPEVAPAAPASKGPNTVTVQGVVIAQPPRSRGSKVLLSRSALFTFLSKRFHYQY